MCLPLQVRMAEDIDFKLPVRQACAAELEAFCADVRHGHARRVRCLQEHLEDENMGEECAEQIRDDEVRSSQEFR
jgi:Golgi apparatus protein 1